MGYGTRALELLVDYYEGKFTTFGGTRPRGDDDKDKRYRAAEMANGSLLDDNIKVRDPRKMPLSSRSWTSVGQKARTTLVPARADQAPSPLPEAGFFHTGVSTANG